jgi:probable HAF family extracellular repeat protein
MLQAIAPAPEDASDRGPEKPRNRAGNCSAACADSYFAASHVGPGRRDVQMAGYNIAALGDPLVQTVSGSEAFGLNSTGMVVGTAYISSGRAVAWNPGPTLIPLGSVASVAYGVNDSGDVVGTRQANAVNVFPGEAFLFRSGVFHDLAWVFPGKESLATDINNAGVIALWAGDIGSSHAYTYDTNSQKATDLGVLPGHDESFAMAINNVGQVAGQSRKSGTPSDPHAFLFDGTLKDLGPATAANDINDSGQVVGGRVVGGASHWTAYRCDTSGGSPQFVDLGALPGFVGSEAMAINNDGDVVGHSVTDWGSSQQIRAFICSAGGQMQDLNALIPGGSGWELTWASAINDTGQIAGTGTINGRRQAFLLTPKSGSGWRRGFDEVAIDPMALILKGKWYQIWVEMHHPHVPKLSDLDVVIRIMPEAERQATLERAAQLGDFGKRVESMIEKSVDVKAQRQRSKAKG